jgi:hypothetical protein
VVDFALSEGDVDSSRDRADSSSDISGVSLEMMLLDAGPGLLVVLMVRPERGGREAGRAVRADVPSATGSVMAVLRV